MVLLSEVSVFLNPSLGSAAMIQLQKLINQNGGTVVKEVNGASHIVSNNTLVEGVDAESNIPIVTVSG